MATELVPERRSAHAEVGGGGGSSTAMARQRREDALAGVLVGAALFGVLYERLAPALRLPQLQIGTGDG